MYSNRNLPSILGVLIHLWRVVVVVVRTLAFWTAVVLPVVYTHLLLVGYTSGADLVFLGKLVGLNIVALVVGHGHGDTAETTIDILRRLGSR